MTRDRVVSEIDVHVNRKCDYFDDSYLKANLSRLFVPTFKARIFKNFNEQTSMSSFARLRSFAKLYLEQKKYEKTKKNRLREILRINKITLSAFNLTLMTGS